MLNRRTFFQSCAGAIGGLVAFALGAKAKAEQDVPDPKYWRTQEEVDILRTMEVWKQKFEFDSEADQKPQENHVGKVPMAGTMQDIATIDGDLVIGVEWLDTGIMYFCEHSLWVYYKNENDCRRWEKLAYFGVGKPLNA